MYPRTLHRNKGHKIQIHKNTKSEYLYYKKELKYTRYVHMHTARAVGNLEKVGPKVWLPKGANKEKSISPECGGSRLRGSKSAAVPPQPPCLFSQPVAWDSRQHPILRVGYETRCGKALPYPRDSLPQDTVARAAGPVNPVSCPVSTLWHGGGAIIITSPLKRKQLPSLGHFQKLGILGTRKEGCSPKPSGALD